MCKAVHTHGRKRMIPLQELCVPLFICNGELRELLGFLITLSISSVTINKHDAALYTCICVRAGRSRRWGLLHLDGFAVNLLAVAVTQVGLAKKHHPGTTRICTKGLLNTSSTELQAGLSWDMEYRPWWFGGSV